MPAAGIVPAFEVVEDGQLGLGPRGNPATVEQLALESLEEALAECIVIGVAHRTHRRLHARVTTPEPEADRGVPTAVIRARHPATGWRAGVLEDSEVVL